MNKSMKTLLRLVNEELTHLNSMTVDDLESLTSDELSRYWILETMKDELEEDGFTDIPFPIHGYTT